MGYLSKEEDYLTIIAIHDYIKKSTPCKAVNCVVIRTKLSNLLNY